MIITLLSGIESISEFNFLITQLGAFIYHNCLAISTLLTIDLQDKNTILLYFTAYSIICAILQINELNVAIISLVSASFITFSKASQICFSDGVLHGFEAFVLSENKSLTPSCHILAILARSAGLSIAGLKSILKSQV
jgi:hypothetical protein